VRLDADLEQALAGAVVDAVAPLQETGKLAGFLLQLSPSFSPKAHELEELRPLVERLAPQVTAIELRNRNWVDGERAGETLEAIADLGAAWVGVDAPQADHFTIMPPVDAVTDDRLAYLRAHGRNADGYLKGRTVAERFGWEYSDDELREIAGRATELAERAEIVNVAFNNNRGRDAPASARRMRELLGQDPGPATDAPEGQLTLG
jgi:uncharacterized protein YecE (DUF72 family)